jgi:hypothetical protein
LPQDLDDDRRGNQYRGPEQKADDGDRQDQFVHINHHVCADRSGVDARFVAAPRFTCSLEATNGWLRRSRPSRRRVLTLNRAAGKVE